jgi:hypothetical protein
MPGQMVAPGGVFPPQQAVLVQGQEPMEVEKVAAGGVPPPQQAKEPLIASMLAAAPPQEQKQILGERLFPLIQRMFPDRAGKITGMLVEIDNAELVHMLEDEKSLKDKVWCGLDLSGCCSILLAGGGGRGCASGARGQGRPVDPGAIYVQKRKFCVCKYYRLDYRLD